MLQRHIAYKIQVGDIFTGKPIFENERFNALECGDNKITRINIIGNIIDKYINEEKKFCTLTLDDGSGQIRLKGFSDQFDLLNKPEIGETVRVIGLLKHYNDEIYILPEIITSIDPKWLNVRMLEIKKIEHTGPKNIEELKAEVAKNLQKKDLAPTIIKDKKSEETSKIEEYKISEEKIESTKEKEDIPSLKEIIKENPKEEVKIENIKYKALEIIQKEKEIDFGKLAEKLNSTTEKLNPVINELITDGEIYELKPGYLCSIN